MDRLWINVLSRRISQSWQGDFGWVGHTFHIFPPGKDRWRAAHISRGLSWPTFRHVLGVALHHRSFQPRFVKKTVPFSTKWFDFRGMKLWSQLRKNATKSSKPFKSSILKGSIMSSYGGFWREIHLIEFYLSLVQRISFVTCSLLPAVSNKARLKLVRIQWGRWRSATGCLKQRKQTVFTRGCGQMFKGENWEAIICLISILKRCFSHQGDENAVGFCLTKLRPLSRRICRIDVCWSLRLWNRP